MTNFPINSLSDLEGRKIGGAGPNLTWLEGLARSAWVPPVHRSTVRSKPDCTKVFCSRSHCCAHLKLNEVATHLTIVDFGAINGGAITINKDKWDNMPAEVQQALLKGATRSEKHRLVFAIKSSPMGYRS